MRLRIEIREPSKPKREQLWDAAAGKALRVGRYSSAYYEPDAGVIVLEDKTVARMHAMIFPGEDPTKIRVLDLGRGGTFVCFNVFGWTQVNDTVQELPCHLRLGRTYITISGTLN